MFEIVYDTIIIGGGPAGCSAAVYAARKKLKTILITESFGGQSFISNDIENWLGETKTCGADLAKKWEAHIRNYPQMIDIKMPDLVNKVTAIACEPSHRVCNFEVSTNSGQRYQAKSLIIASGARRRRLGVPGEDQFEGKGLVFCSTCDAPLFANKRVVVIGGGNAGLEMVHDLYQYASEVYLMDQGPVLKADPMTIDEIKGHAKLKAIILNAKILEVFGDKLVQGIKYQDQVSGENKSLEIDGIFVAIGSVPNSEMVNGLVNVDPHGQIIIDAKYATTSHPGIFAAGDVSDDPYKQNMISAGDGVRAALSAYFYLLNRQKVSPVVG